MKITFYRTAGGASPVEKYLVDLDSKERAAVADALKGIEISGLIYRTRYASSSPLISRIGQRAAGAPQRGARWRFASCAAGAQHSRVGLCSTAGARGRRVRVDGTLVICLTILERLGRYDSLCGQIVAFWLEPDHRSGRTWTEHRDINEVLLATALAPEGFLVPRPVSKGHSTQTTLRKRAGGR